jgi:predicted nuclease with TOPRIM domain
MTGREMKSRLRKLQQLRDRMNQLKAENLGLAGRERLNSLRRQAGRLEDELAKAERENPELAQDLSK